METNIFTQRTTPWKNLGTNISGIFKSQEALMSAGLDWNVVQKDIVTEDGIVVQGYKANVRESDNRVLGVVTSKYKVIQNKDCYAFIDDLIGEGVRFEKAGYLQGGRRTWIVARLPETYVISGDSIIPYLVVTNSHDGSSGIRIFISPVRVACANMLNFALRKAIRSWSATHCGEIGWKLEDAKKSLVYSSDYMAELGKTIGEMERKTFSDKKVMDYIDELYPVLPNLTDQQKKNVVHLREDLKVRYFEAPDLQEMKDNAYKFVLACSDHATHMAPLRERSTFQESLFSRSVAGNELIDKAYHMVMAA